MKPSLAKYAKPKQSKICTKLNKTYQTKQSKPYPLTEPHPLICISGISFSNLTPEDNLIKLRSMKACSELGTAQPHLVVPSIYIKHFVCQFVSLSVCLSRFVCPKQFVSYPQKRGGQTFLTHRREGGKHFYIERGQTF